MDKEANTKVVLNRISRSAGHLGGIKKMIEDGRDCKDILIQLYAVRAEITSVSKLLLKNYTDDCITDAVSGDGEGAVLKLKEAIDVLL